MLRRPALAGLLLSAPVLLAIALSTVQAQNLAQDQAQNLAQDKTRVETLPPRPVVSEIVKADVVNQRVFTGLVDAQKEIDLAFQAAGNLLERKVDVGDNVKKGDLIASLDRVTLADDVSIAQAALEGALVAQKTTRASLERALVLAQKNITAQASVEALRSASLTADSQVQQAQAALIQARNSFSFTSLVAPADGTIISTEENPGATVSAGAKIATMATSTGRDAVVDMPEEFIGFLSDKDIFSISLRFGDVPPVEGRLRLVEPVADISTRSRRVRIELLTTPAAYRLGSLVRVSRTTAGSKVISLPQSAIFEENGAAYAWRVVPDGRTVERVRLAIDGPAERGRLVVEGGIAEGDEIVTKGVNSLEAGQAVGAQDTR